MSEKKIYIGSGKKKGEGWGKATINIDKLQPYIKNFKGHNIVKVDINFYDEPDQYGKDVKITIDTWNPEKQNDPNPRPEYYTPSGGNAVKTQTVDEEEIPF